MIFQTDKQTLNDLQIFGKSGKNSIFSLFNRTYTQGGAGALTNIFEFPSTGAAEISDRSSVIRYFHCLKSAFPLESAWFEAFVPYLADRDTRTLLNRDGVSLERKLSQLLGADTEVQRTQKALHMLGKCLSKLHLFLKDLGPDLPESNFKAKKEEGLQCFADEDFRSAVAKLDSGKLSFDHLIHLDRYMRFTQIDRVQFLLDLCYELDVFIALATVARERGFAYADLLSDTNLKVDVKGFYHPLMAQAVGNDLCLGDGHNVLFLTGANMAGKSTFMKSLGITVYLAHLGLPIPAASMQFTLFDGLFSTINLADSLQLGHSHFYAEVLRVKQVSLELAAGKRLFVIFDELFRGTNVKDAYEATVAITQLYAKLANSLFVVSTHIIEAADELKNTTPSIYYAYMPTEMQGTQPIYPYRLRQGVTADRHGMLIIQNEQILDILAKGKKGGAYA